MGIVTGLIEQLILGLIHFAIIAMDVVFFFLLVRVLAMRWPKRVVIGLDRIGAPLVEPLTSAVGKTLPSVSVKGRLLLLVVLLTLCRLSLMIMMQPLT